MAGVAVLSSSAPGDSQGLGLAHALPQRKAGRKEADGGPTPAHQLPSLASESSRPLIAAMTGREIYETMHKQLLAAPATPLFMSRALTRPVQPSAAAAAW